MQLHRHGPHVLGPQAFGLHAYGPHVHAHGPHAHPPHPQTWVCAATNEGAGGTGGERLWPLWQLSNPGERLCEGRDRSRRQWRGVGWEWGGSGLIGSCMCEGVEFRNTVVTLEGRQQYLVPYFFSDCVRVISKHYPRYCAIYGQPAAALGQLGGSAGTQALRVE